MTVDRVLDIPADERRRPAGKSAGASPRQRLEGHFVPKRPDVLPGKASKLQFSGDRTVNRHWWAS